MPEHVRPRNREVWGGGVPGLDDVFAGAGTVAPVTVCSGLYSEPLPVGDMTVGEIRARYHDRFDIDPESHAMVDGHDVGDDTVVKPGQLLTFVRRAGEKGEGRTEGPTGPARDDPRG